MTEAGAEDPAVFEAERPRLLGLAYRMLGSLADAEDVVQDAWLRWRRTEPAGIERPAAWLTTVTTRLSLDRIRTRGREPYVGPWLPEPVVAGPGPEEAAELADSLTLGFLTVLDRLNPVERAVFLLADVFGAPFAEVAEAVGKSPAACRQIASRARRRLRDAHPRPVPGPDRRLVDELVMAIALGDVDGVLARLAPDVICVTDGGPARRAARRPVRGADRVARLLVNLSRRMAGDLSVSPATVNREPGVIISLGGAVDVVAAFEVDGDRVSAIRMVRNPDKLQRVGAPIALR